MDRTQRKELLAEVEAAARAAGEIVARAWDAPKSVRRKGRIDLVTETDLAVEAFLRERLGRLLPECVFLGEESAPDADPGDLAWIVDPLDGTTNFAHGFPFVCSSLALWEKGRPTLGVIHAPMLGETYTAAEGQGSRRNGRACRVSETDAIEAALAATGFPYAIHEHLDEILRQLGRVLGATQGVRRAGSAALDLAGVACGRLDAFYEAALNPWDVAAGWLLVVEAGGRVTAYDPDVAYALGAPAILATNGRLHQVLADLLA